MTLRIILLCGLLGVSSVGVLWALRNKEAVFQFPFVLSATMLAYIMPQARAIAVVPGLVPDSAYIPTMIHSIACITCAYLGYFYFNKKARPRPVCVTYDDQKLFIVGAAVVLVGTIAKAKLSLMSGGLITHYSTEGVGGFEWRGFPVYLAFLSKLTVPGLTLCLISILLKRNRPVRRLVFAMGLIYPVFDIVFLGRRSQFFAIVAMFLFSFFFFKGYRLSRKYIPIGLVVAFLVVFLFPSYRTHMRYDSDHSMLLEIDPRHEISRYIVEVERGLPFVYAALGIGALRSPADFRWGTGFYNGLIKQYVPRGILGQTVKDSLFISSTRGLVQKRRLEEYGTRGKFYLVPTGIGDSFYEFGYFGCLLYFLFGRFFRRMYDAFKYFDDMRSRLFLSMFSLSASICVYASWTGGFAQIIFPLSVFFIVDRFAKRKSVRHAGFQPRKTFVHETPKVSEGY